MNVVTRASVPKDAKAMSSILAEILCLWKSDRPSDPGHVLAHYINNPDRVACTVAVGDSGKILGFQSLKRALAGNQYGVTPGWGIIGSYVRGSAAGKGVGHLLFRASHDAARQAGLPAIDATIGAENKSGLTYYDAIGFYTYLTPPGRIRKRYDLV